MSPKTTNFKVLLCVLQLIQMGSSLIDLDDDVEPHLFEGDMVGFNHHNIEDLVRQSNEANRLKDPNVYSGAAINDPFKLWPDGKVYYTLSCTYTQEQRRMIVDALEEYHQLTCIRFIPRENEQDYVYVKRGQGCSSSVGTEGGRQELSLESNCLHKGIIIHEFMHALGFFHEQSRWDRDIHVDVKLENVYDHEKHNFKKYELDRLKDLHTPYDYGSVMHYGSHFFSSNSKPTIVAKDPNVQIGQRSGLSLIDIKEINLLYGCNRHTTSRAIQKIDTNKLYYVVNMATGTVLDASGCDELGCKIYADTKQRHLGQLWKFRPHHSSSTYSIDSVSTGRCLNDPYDSRVPGTQMILWGMGTSGLNEQFMLTWDAANNGWKITLSINSMSLDLSSSRTQTKREVTFHVDNGSPLQRWSLAPALWTDQSAEMPTIDPNELYYVVNVATGTVMDASGCMQIGCKIYADIKRPISGQLWKFRHLHNSTYSIDSASTGRCLNDPYDSHVPGTQMILWDRGTSAPNEQFVFKWDSANKGWKITLSINSMSLDLSSSTPQTKSEVTFHIDNDSPAQRWSLEPAW